MKIGFIGLGNMGASLAKAVLQAKTCDDILLANRSQAKVDAFIANFGGQASSNEEIFAEADVIFLGVKPAQFSELLSQYQTILEKRESLLLISMAAGLTLEKLASLLPSQHRIIRMMPNTPASIGQGVISYALSSNCRAEDSELFCQLLTKAGLLVELGEGLIDAATGLAGCGPAFVYLFYRGLGRCRCSDWIATRNSIENGSSNCGRSWAIGLRKPATSWSFERPSMQPRRFDYRWCSKLRSTCL